MTSLPRIAGIAVGTIGIGAVAARLALDASGGDDAPDGMLVSGIGVGVGALGIAGGTMLGRTAEQSLRPGLARSGRTVAAVGAALIAGSLVGEVASRFVGITDGRRAAGDMREELARQQARIDAPQDVTKEAQADAARFEQLAEEFLPLPADAAARPRVDDGRLDVAGAQIGAAARALHQMYDVNDDDLISMDEQQRAISGGSASIATLMSVVHGAKAAEAGRADEPVAATVGDLEKVIADRVDIGGIEGVLDNDEATAWFGPDGIGEKAMTWDGASTFMTGIAQPAWKDASHTYAPGPWRDGGDDILYLAGVTDETTAKQRLAELSANRHPAALLVELPEGAPTEYGVVSLLMDGKAEGKPYDDTLKLLELDSAVIAAQSRGDVHDL